MCLLLAPSTVAQPTSGAAPRPPNILFALADDWGYGHAGTYGDKVVKTPTFDRVAREGVLFQNAFCAAPSCTASRGAILTGRFPHQLEEGGNLWSTLPRKFVTYPDLLEARGYAVGMTRKGWGPGDFKLAGRARNPAGPTFRDFEQFRRTVPADKPWCFWFGSHDPHRPYVLGTGERSRLKPADVFVPPYLPDAPEVRGDICDYYFAVERYDREVGEILKQLEQAGELDNTLVVMTGDNGWPFPRSKANLYGVGTHESMAARWPAGGVRAGNVVSAFVSLADLAPTFLEAAGLPPQPAMSAHSILPMLRGATPEPARDAVLVERERHANVRAGDLGYPARAVRTADFLYIRNLRPDRWPAGDPTMWKSVGPFGDIDGGPTKSYLLDHREESEVARLFDLACAKRPADELYDLRKDPWELDNLAARPEHAADLAAMRARLDRWLKETADPVTDADEPFDRYPYTGERNAGERNAPAGKPPKE